MFHLKTYQHLIAKTYINDCEKEYNSHMERASVRVLQFIYMYVCTQACMCGYMHVMKCPQHLYLFNKNLAVYVRLC